MATAPSMSSIIHLGEAVSSICSFLSLRGTDTLRLLVANREWHNSLAVQEESLFDAHLVADFPEGSTLSFVAKERGLCRKKLYLAFIHRWSVPKRVSPDERVIIHWRKPPSLTSLGMKEDDSDAYEFPTASPEDAGWEYADSGIPRRPVSEHVDIGSLVFIARVGVDKDDTELCSCALMDWEYYGTSCKESGKKLVPDYHRNEDNEGHLGVDGESACEIMEKATLDDKDDWYDRLRKTLSETHCLTLHAIDVQSYQVISLLDETRLGENDGPDFSGRGDLWIGHNSLKNVYALPPRDSPHYRKLSKRDFPTSCVYAEYDDNRVSPFEVRGGLDVRFDYYVKKDYVKNEGDDDQTQMRFCQPGVGIEMCADDFERDGLAIHFNLGYSLSVNHICSFIRTLIKEKCVALSGGQSPVANDIPLALPPVQPEWIEIDEILDNVSSYASFENQAGKLRLICKRFGVSALRQLESKVDKVKVIGYQCDYEFGEDWHKVSVHRGWSENSLASKACAVEDALWFASCRCSMSKCEDRAACPSAGKPMTYSDDGVAKVLDIEKARQSLGENGRLRLGTLRASASYSRKEMSLFELCDKVVEIINGRLEAGLLFEGQEPVLHPYLKKDYKVAADMSPTQFIRSLFLAMARKKEEGGGIPAAKRACINSNEVSIGVAEGEFRTEDGRYSSSCYYSRKKKIFRFLTSAHEPMEIVIESKSNSE